MMTRLQVPIFSGAVVDRYHLTELARRIEALSESEWGSQQPTVLVGQDASILEVQEKLYRFAQADKPILLTGETGTGKELFARALYLLSRRRQRPFIRVNCAQYHDGQLIASELFGHKRGSFTGAVNDHRGIFQDAAGGVVFLDEIGELSIPAQSMLLRVLGEGEIVPVGQTRPIRVDVRVIAATSRDLEAMVAQGTFRKDLYYRLRHFQLRIPALRERGDDWELLLEYYLKQLVEETAERKHFSAESLDLLRTYHWPGNIRELKGMVDTGFHLSRHSVIDPGDFLEALELNAPEPVAPAALPIAGIHPFPRKAAPGAGVLYDRMVRGGQSFWDVVRTPFLERELSRGEVREIVARGLREADGSYKDMLPLFGLDQGEYLRFMDFLRHHKLKPERRRAALVG
jgi:DNA-binding NtrC family response regulator